MKASTSVSSPTPNAHQALYDIKVEYKDVTDTAELHLFWESSSQGTQVILHPETLHPKPETLNPEY